MANRIIRSIQTLFGSAPAEVRTAPAQTVSPFVAWALGEEGTANKTFDQVAKKAFEENVIGYRCVSLIANSIGALNWCLRKKSDKSDVDSNPLIDLINRPNPLQSKGVFFAHGAGSLLLDGNVFVEKVGPVIGSPRELWVLRPDCVTVRMGSARLPIAYDYVPSTGGGVQKSYPVNPITGECDLLHTMSYSPLYETSMGRGLSPMRSAWLAILSHTEGQRQNLALLKNGARPSGAFVTGGGKTGVGNVTPEVLAGLKEQIAELMQGANKHKAFVLDGGMDWKEMSLSPKDMDYANLKNDNARDIARALGVPTQLLGIPGDNTFSNYEQAHLSFYEDTVLPLAYSLVSELNHWLVPDFGDDLELYIDEDKISALEPRREIKWARAQTSTFLTIDEKREMVGYEPYVAAKTPGEEILVPSNVVPLGESIDTSETTPTPAPAADDVP